MKYLLSASPLALLLAASLSSAATFPSPSWTRQLPPGSVLGVGDAALDPSGNLIVAADSSISNFMVIRKISPAGNLLWEKDYSGGTARAVLVDSTGNTFVAGSLFIPASGSVPAALDVLVVKYSPAGDVLWSAHSGNPGVSDLATSIVIDDQGSVYAAGSSTGATSTDLYLVKYSAAGVEQWTRRFDGSAHLEDKASGIVAVPGGGVAVTGLTRNPAEQFITIRYSATGTAQWVSFYDAPGQTEQQPAGILRALDGGFVVTGMSGNNDVSTVKYSAAGAQGWVNHVGITNSGSVADIIAGPAGETGILFTDGTATRLAAVAADGSTRWNTVIRSDTAGPGVVSANPSGGYLTFTGTSTYSSSGNYHLARLSCVDANGGGLSHTAPFSPVFSSDIRPLATAVTSGGAFWGVATDRGQIQVVRYGPEPVIVPPTATTTGYDSLTAWTVQLKGSVNPNGGATSWYYEYGLTTSYGQSTPVRSIPGGNSVMDAFEPNVTVNPGTVYHFRLVATNSEGTRYGDDMTFTVPASAWQQWIVTYFGSAGAPGSGPADDPDFDGITNAVEYAFAGNPVTPGAVTGLPAAEMWESPDSGITFLSIVYYPAPGRPDVTITPVGSSDLTSWSAGGIVTMDLPGGGKRAVAQSSQKFLRLNIVIQ